MQFKELWYIKILSFKYLKNSLSPLSRVFSRKLESVSIGASSTTSIGTDRQLGSMDPEEISRLCEKLSIAEEGAPEMQNDPKLHEMGMRNVSLSLVGKIISNKEVNKEAFKATIAKI
ncbi:hypothetical protein ACOSQ2_008383 [Xanthoceras sorbifolium]